MRHRGQQHDVIQGLVLSPCSFNLHFKTQVTSMLCVLPLTVNGQIPIIYSMQNKLFLFLTIKLTHSAIESSWATTTNTIFL